MSKPLVSVICMCHNHGTYVAAAIQSVLDQTYQPIELIAVDDSSTDHSAEVIRQLADKHHFQTIFNDRNLGNCKSFNLAFKKSSGDYIIDLSADDLLLPQRVEAGIKDFMQLPPDYGVQFCDVEFVDAGDRTLGSQYRRPGKGKIVEKVPSGNVYIDLLSRHFISAPGMMMRRKVFEILGGYDESLSYEDFDFWVRSSRTFLYHFNEQILVRKRVLKHSLSSYRYRKYNLHILSTAKVCAKALKLNKDHLENTALLRRCNYEIQWAIATESWEACRLFLEIMTSIGIPKSKYRAIHRLIRLRPPIFWLTNILMGIKKKVSPLY